MSIQLAVGITVAVAAVAVVAVLILRRLAPPNGFWGEIEPNHSGSAMGVLGGAFTILVAFVMFLSFQSYLNARRSVDVEAATTQHLFESADLFGQPVRDGLRGTAVCYARGVITDEWPRMRNGERSTLVDGWALRLERSLERADFTDPRELQAYADGAELDRLREDNREQRLDEAHPFIPPLLWVALIAGGVLLLAYVCSFANPAVSVALQVVLVIAVATVVTLNLCVVRFLDAPYADNPGSLEPTRMHEALAAMETQAGHHFHELRPPCDRTGRPDAA